MLIDSKVVELDNAYRERTQTHQLHTYMYGEVINPPAGVTSYTLGGDITTDLLLAPLSTAIPFGDLSLFRIGEGV
jgi:polyribonucleotide 5'-hydroxyl-kinase